jgi:hypothetical protein
MVAAAFRFKEFETIFPQIANESKTTKSHDEDDFTHTLPIR